MTKTFIPRDYQRQALAHLLERPRSALWAGMGMGKTVATLTVLDALFLAGETAPALICAPLRVAQTTWPNEVKKWKQLGDLQVRPILGSAAERRAAISDSNANVFTINYENLPWLVDTVGVKHWPFTTVVADESTKLKGFRLRQGTTRAQALATVAHSRVKRFIELTGTPAPNGLIDLWGQAWFLDQGQRLGNSFSAFQDRWFSTTTYGGYCQIKPLATAQAQIEERLRDLCLTLDPSDHFDLQQPITTVVPVQLPAKVRQQYQKLERELWMQVEDTTIEAFNAAACTMKCLQLCNGAVYKKDDDGADNSPWLEIHNTKLAALEDIIEESAGMPVLVAYQFKSDLARLLKAFPKGRWLDDSPQTEADWNAGKIPVLFAHPKSAGHGLNLQDGGNIIVFFGHWWDLELRQQIIERIGPVRQAQSGHKRAVFIYDIVAIDTIDEEVLARHQTKSQTQDLILEAMKRRDSTRRFGR